MFNNFYNLFAQTKEYTMNIKNRSAKLSVVSLLFLVLLNYPFLSIANQPKMLFGIPVLFVYLFVCWVLFIFIIYRIVNK
jgi:hypothetical protein